MLCIKRFAVHPDICVLFGGKCPVVIGALCAGGGTLATGAESDCCAGASVRGAFGYAGTPGSAVSCSGVQTVCHICL